jgi:uncharacterized cupin superfamily protein
MKVLSRQNIADSLVDHPPYPSNPALRAKLSILYYSSDGSTLIAYYEAPEGWFDVEVQGFAEMDYVLEGEVELVSDRLHLTAKPGDCFFLEEGDEFRWKMTKPSKMVFVLNCDSDQVRKSVAELVRFCEQGLPRSPS